MTKTYDWEVGGGQVTISYDGNSSGNKTITISSSENTSTTPRSMKIIFSTQDGSSNAVLTINQDATSNLVLGFGKLGVNTLG